VLQQPEVTEAGVLRKRHPDPVGPHALARADEQPVGVGGHQPGVRQRGLDRLDREPGGGTARPDRHGGQAEAGDRGLRAHRPRSSR
jgi:hypothetical protein